MPKLPSEFQIQRAHIIWASTNLLPGVVHWHTPNGGRRDPREAKALKEMGVLAGIPDWFALWGRLYAIEFKEPGGRKSPAQIALHPRLIAAGAYVETVDNIHDARRLCANWGLTVNAGGDSIRT